MVDNSGEMFYMKRHSSFNSPLLSHIIVPNWFVQDVNALIVSHDNNFVQMVYTILNKYDYLQASRDMSYVRWETYQKCVPVCQK